MRIIETLDEISDEEVRKIMGPAYKAPDRSYPTYDDDALVITHRNLIQRVTGQGTVDPKHVGYH